jgi:pimeloyl-ACP methyl ester carboxylesterase
VRETEMLGEPESGFAEVAGTSLYYEVVGNGEPLVLVHAGIADRRMWDWQLGAFAEDHRVIRYDIRGWAAARRRRERPSPSATTCEGCSTPLVSSGLTLWVAR